MTNSSGKLSSQPLQGWGTADMVSPLRKVLVRTPTTVGDFVGQAQWREPDRDLLLVQHREFVQLLGNIGAQVLVAEPVEGLVDSVYTHDPAVMTPFGAVLLRMRKPVRRPEPEAMRADFERMGVPLLGQLTEPAWSDGGDKVWLDAQTLVVGRSYRTNAAAIEQFRAILAPHGVNVVDVDLPHYLGPDAVLHLMSVISPVSHDLAVVYEPLAPVALLEMLDERGIRRITVDEDEMLTQGANILAVAPGEVVLGAGNDKVRRKLEEAGVKVSEFSGSEVAVKGDGGPTCLTQPLWRK